MPASRVPPPRGGRRRRGRQTWGWGALSRARLGRLPVSCGQFSSAARHLGSGTSHAHPMPASRMHTMGPAARSGPVARTRARACFPSVSTGIAHGSQKLGAEGGALGGSSRPWAPMGHCSGLWEVQVSVLANRGAGGSRTPPPESVN